MSIKGRSLFDSAEPDESGETEEITIEPLPIDEADVEQTVDEWEDEEEPVQWLFEKEGRGKLASYAVKALSEDDAVYLNQSDLGREADVSRHSVHRHIQTLVDLNVYEVRDGKIRRYRPNKDSRIVRAIATLNNEIASQHGEIQ